jgi:hypothetical protein
LTQDRSEVYLALLSQLEEPFQVDRRAQPEPLELPLALPQVAGVAQAMVHQFGPLALDGVAQPVERLELGRSSPVTGRRV